MLAYPQNRVARRQTQVGVPGNPDHVVSWSHVGSPAPSPVERWTDEGLATRQEFDSTLTSSLLPGFELDLIALFAG